jgi:hypothetical protein
MVPDRLTAIWQRANSAEEIGLKTQRFGECGVSSVVPVDAR